jgi:hypothetical protein
MSDTRVIARLQPRRIRAMHTGLRALRATLSSLCPSCPICVSSVLNLLPLPSLRPQRLCVKLLILSPAHV